MTVYKYGDGNEVRVGDVYKYGSGNCKGAPAGHAGVYTVLTLPDASGRGTDILDGLGVKGSYDRHSLVGCRLLSRAPEPGAAPAPTEAPPTPARDLVGADDPNRTRHCMPTPPHYIEGRDPAYEPRHVIRAWSLGYNLGSAVKYISRFGRKGGPADHIKDLKKAIDFLRFEIEYLEGRDPAKGKD